MVVLDVFRSVDPVQLKYVLNASSLTLAPRKDAETVTKQKIGNISPLYIGDKKEEIVTVVDSHLFDPDQNITARNPIDGIIYGGAGISGWELKISLDDLVAAGLHSHYMCQEFPFTIRFDRKWKNYCCELQHNSHLF